MDLRWINKATKEIGVVFVTDDDVRILETIGYHHCHEEDFTDDEFDGALVEIWKP